MSVEIAANNWAAAESIAVSLLDDPGLDDDQRAGTLLRLASARAARGALKAAATTLEQMEEVARRAAAPLSFQDRARRGRLMLAIVSGAAIPPQADAWARDSSTATLLTRGLWAAIGADRATAQRLLDAVRTRSRHELAWQGATPALLEARIAALAGRWDEVARILRPIASPPVEIGRVLHPAGMSAVRWLLADAFEKLGQPDSAAVWLERVTSDPSPGWQESYLRGIVIPLAHRRLVLLYARMGRIEDARHHWQVFAATYRTPDPELQPLIAEARGALMSAEGMARSARR